MEVLRNRAVLAVLMTAAIWLSVTTSCKKVGVTPEPEPVPPTRMTFDIQAADAETGFFTSGDKAGVFISNCSFVTSEDAKAAPVGSADNLLLTFDGQKWTSEQAVVWNGANPDD